MEMAVGYGGNVSRTAASGGILMRAWNKSGQLFMPMMVLMLLFGLFLSLYVRWCGRVYWQMRMDIAAEAVALSAARAQAAMLNNLATLQTAGNGFFQKAGVGQVHVAHVQVQMADQLNEYHETIQFFLRGYLGNAMGVASLVAKKNRATHVPAPFPKPTHYLNPQNVAVIFFAKWFPLPYPFFYENLFYARDWKNEMDNPQPVHKNAWAVAHNDIVGVASARLWLDVDPSDPIANGGFPRLKPNLFEGFGVQCLFPHFNARLAPTSAALKRTLAPLAKQIPL
jgi:hypothetical protein